MGELFLTILFFWTNHIITHTDSSTQHAINKEEHLGFELWLQYVHENVGRVYNWATLNGDRYAFAHTHREEGREIAEKRF